MPRFFQISATTWVNLDHIVSVESISKRQLRLTTLHGVRDCYDEERIAQLRRLMARDTLELEGSRDS